MRYVILDIDDVLNRESIYLSRPCVDILRQITEASEPLNWVLSSTWRLWRSLEEIASMINAFGLTNIHFCGLTPVVHSVKFSGLVGEDSNGNLISPPFELGARGLEIQAWLAKNATPEDHVVILDDNGWVGPLKPLLVKTRTFGKGMSPEEAGLQPEHVAKALDILSKPLKDHGFSSTPDIQGLSSCFRFDWLEEPPQFDHHAHYRQNEKNRMEGVWAQATRGGWGYG